MPPSPLPCPALQVIDWMKNPVPASQYAPDCPDEKELLALLPQGTSLCVMPNEGCDYVSARSWLCCAVPAALCLLWQASRSGMLQPAPAPPPLCLLPRLIPALLPAGHL